DLQRAVVAETKLLGVGEIPIWFAKKLPCQRLDQGNEVVGEVGVGRRHDRLPANLEDLCARGGPSPSPPEPSSPGGPRSQLLALRRCRRRARALGWRNSRNTHSERKQAARLFSPTSSHGQKPSGIESSPNNRSRSAAASMSPIPSDRGTQNTFSDAM